MSTSKRRKLSTSCWEATENVRIKLVFTLETLPPEVLETILTFLPMQVVAGTFRLVSRHCQLVANILLNGAFFSAGHRLESALNYAKERIYTVKNNTDLLVFTKAFNILELVRMQYRLLRAVTWRYTHPPRPERFPRLCFYPGGLLDRLNRILYLTKTQPASLIGPNGPETIVSDFSNLCKRFMNYFEKVSERKFNRFDNTRNQIAKSISEGNLGFHQNFDIFIKFKRIQTSKIEKFPRSPLVSGCKAVDILDCLTEGRKLLSFRVTPGRGNRGSIVCMRLQYTMRRAWFTCLQVPCTLEEGSWRDEQRFMYLRLRRLVASVNEHYYEGIHFEREISIQTRTAIAPKVTLPSTYSGYGEYGGQFFYYGNMNRQAYTTKWHRPAESEEYQEYPELQPKDMKLFPTYDLVIGIELRCSPELAPLVIRPILKSDDVDNSRPLSHNPEMYLKMTVNCPASSANRLPGHFVWEQRARKEKPPS
ncbi:uncharacterized protein LOC107048838 [Diachasma alloeum]|uniref:uncharacterized protein LOC107048838 n=1 Tax=Diachasma alloeum TaxID=454923 RepID=UPI0007383546|nr:uncharacterized protein LOC107048838 [Diachasma alloeum]